MEAQRATIPTTTTPRSVLWHVWKWLREHIDHHLLGPGDRLHSRPIALINRLPFNNPQGNSTSPGRAQTLHTGSIPSAIHS